MWKMTTTFACAAALAACAAMEVPAGDLTPEARMPYVQTAAASDLFEIQSGQLAAQRAQRADVRAFGQTLVAHHQQTTQQLTAAARASGVTPAPALLPMHRQMLDELQRLSGEAFDERFLDQQETAHEMALALHQNYARAGDTPALRTVAAAAVPIISQHLAQARQLDR